MGTGMKTEYLFSLIGSEIDFGYGPKKIVSIFDSPVGPRFSYMSIPAKVIGHGWINCPSVVYGPFLPN